MPSMFPVTPEPEQPVPVRPHFLESRIGRSLIRLTIFLVLTFALWWLVAGLMAPFAGALVTSAISLGAGFGDNGRRDAHLREAAVIGCGAVLEPSGRDASGAGPWAGKRDVAVDCGDSVELRMGPPRARAAAPRCRPHHSILGFRSSHRRHGRRTALSGLRVSESHPGLRPLVFCTFHICFVRPWAQRQSSLFESEPAEYGAVWHLVWLRLLAHTRSLAAPGHAFCMEFYSCRYRRQHQWA